MLRANDLIWSFVVNNYLMGKDPFPFDLLFWNADATRMPAAMHSYYLRNMYQKNLLVQPGGLTIDNVPIDLAQDHDPGLPAGRQGGPHRARQVGLQGDADLLRPGALHAGGLGPHRRRRQSAAQQEVPALAERDGQEPADARRMAGRRQEFPGSWWNDWDKWLSAKSGPKVPARVPGDRRPARDRGRARQLREGADDRLMGDRACGRVGWLHPFRRDTSISACSAMPLPDCAVSQSRRECFPTAIGPRRVQRQFRAGFRAAHHRRQGPSFRRNRGFRPIALPPLLGGEDAGGSPCGPYQLRPRSQPRLLKSMLMNIMPILCRRRSAGIRHNIAQDRQAQDGHHPADNSCVPPEGVPVRAPALQASTSVGPSACHASEI